MKKVKFFFLSLMTMVMCGMIASCNPADIVEEVMDYEEYFIALDYVETNLINQETGASLAEAILAEFKFDQSGSKSQSLGKLKSDEVAKESFEQSCKAIKDSYDAAYEGIMPEGGYINYYLSLRMQKADGYKLASKTITIE